MHNSCKTEQRWSMRIDSPCHWQVITSNHKTNSGIPVPSTHRCAMVAKSRTSPVTIPVTYLLEFDKEIQWWILELMDQRYHRTNFWRTCNHSLSCIMRLWASPTQLINNIRPTFVLIYQRSMVWGKWHTSSSVYVKFKAGKKLPLCSSQCNRMSFASTALRVLCRGICSELVWESGVSDPV
jgi:hypothetical protein